MAKKRNQELRTRRDERARKSIKDGKGWTERLLEELHEGVEPEEIPVTGVKADVTKKQLAD